MIAMIQTEQQYNALVARIEELLKDSSAIEIQNSTAYIELHILSDLIADYEEEHYPIAKPV